MGTTKFSQKIIFIDDEDSLATPLKNALVREGLLFHYVRNANDSINTIKKEKPDLVITDLIMPKMNGFEVIKRIQSKNVDCKANIIILTNYGNTDLMADKTFLDSLGIKKYLVKSSYTIKELVKEIENALA